MVNPVKTVTKGKIEPRFGRIDQNSEPYLFTTTPFIEVLIENLFEGELSIVQTSLLQRRKIEYLDSDCKSGKTMPVLSRFYGIVIFMNYRDHNPPHFHARYQDYEIIVEIKSGLVQGKMPKRALQFIFEWVSKYEKELMDNWELARERKALKSIPPLS